MAVQFVPNYNEITPGGRFERALKTLGFVQNIQNQNKQLEMEAQALSSRLATDSLTQQLRQMEIQQMPLEHEARMREYGDQQLQRDRSFLDSQSRSDRAYSQQTNELLFREQQAFREGQERAVNLKAKEFDRILSEKKMKAYDDALAGVPGAMKIELKKRYPQKSDAEIEQLANVHAQQGVGYLQQLQESNLKMEEFNVKGRITVAGNAIGRAISTLGKVDLNPRTRPASEAAAAAQIKIAEEAMEVEPGTSDLSIALNELRALPQDLTMDQARVAQYQAGIRLMKDGKTEQERSAGARLIGQSGMVSEDFEINPTTGMPRTVQSAPGAAVAGSAIQSELDKRSSPSATKAPGAGVMVRQVSGKLFYNEEARRFEIPQKPGEGIGAKTFEARVGPDNQPHPVFPTQAQAIEMLPPGTTFYSIDLQGWGRTPNATR
jgi:hypothetical protein